MSDDYYDSDVVDEEEEHKLYESIFYGQTIDLPRDDCNRDHDDAKAIVLTDSPIISPVVETAIKSDDKSLSNQVQLSTGGVKISLLTPHSSPSSDGSDSSSDSSFSSRYRPGRSRLANKRRASASSSDIILGGVNRASVFSAIDNNSAIASLLANTSDDPDLWQTSARQSFSSKHARYFDSPSTSSACRLCNSRGHLTLDCRGTEPVCIFCGSEGHIRSDCPQQYCFACFAYGHVKRDCQVKRLLSQSTCDRCGSVGHQTATSPGLPVKAKLPPGNKKRRNPRLSCCNCGQLGHSVDDCKRRPSPSDFLGQTVKRRILVYDKTDIYAHCRRLRQGTANDLVKVTKRGKVVKQKQPIGKTGKNKNKEKTKTKKQKNVEIAMEHENGDININVNIDEQRYQEQLGKLTQHQIECYSKLLSSADLGNDVVVEDEAMTDFDGSGWETEYVITDTCASPAPFKHNYHHRQSSNALVNSTPRTRTPSNNHSPRGKRQSVNVRAVKNRPRIVDNDDDSSLVIIDYCHGDQSSTNCTPKSRPNSTNKSPSVAKRGKYNQLNGRGRGECQPSNGRPLSDADWLDLCQGRFATKVDSWWSSSPPSSQQQFENRHGLPKRISYHQQPVVKQQNKRQWKKGGVKRRLTNTRV